VGRHATIEDYATKSSINALIKSASDMQQAALLMEPEDPEASEMILAKAHDNIAKARELRALYTRKSRSTSVLHQTPSSHIATYATQGSAIPQQQQQQQRNRRDSWIQINFANSNSSLRTSWNRTGSNDSSGSWNGEAMRHALEASTNEYSEREVRRQTLLRSLRKWGFEEYPVPDDNNCQFHALADQINRCGDYSVGGIRLRLDALGVRELCVRWMQENAELLMDDDGIGEPTSFQQATGCWSDDEWEGYLQEMSKHGTTWGDEATLLAACAVFDCEVVVISSLHDDCLHQISCPMAWGRPLPRRKICIAHYAEFHYASVQYSEKALMAAELAR